MAVKKEYDVIIIGSGPAGLSSAIYTCRKNLETLVIGKELGGQIAYATNIENYPGIYKTSGIDLMNSFHKQAISFGAKIVYEEVSKIKKQKGYFTVKTSVTEYKSKAVILAFGKTPRNLNVKGEKELLGKGISYCATCDAFFFKGKTVAVVGGGNAAIDACILLESIAKKVYSIHRREEFAADETLVEKAEKMNKIEFLGDNIVEEFKGKDSLNAIVLENTKTKKKSEIKVDGCFIEIGSEVKTDFIKGLVKLDKIGQIVINEKCETSEKGIFAAGDITSVPFKQTIVAAGEGAKAALQSYNYIKGIKTLFTSDWKHAEE